MSSLFGGTGTSNKVQGGLFGPPTELGASIKAGGKVIRSSADMEASNKLEKALFGSCQDTETPTNTNGVLFSSFGNKTRSQMRQELIKLYDSGLFTDLEIICGSQTFKVHKVVVCAQSRYFLALPSFAEGQTSRIVLKTIDSDNDDDPACDDPEAIKHMIHFFYAHDYGVDLPSPIMRAEPENCGTTPATGTPTTTIATTEAAGIAVQSAQKQDAQKVSFERSSTQPLAWDGNMLTHARVFAAATKYQIEALKTIAAQRFESAVKLHWYHPSFAEAVRVVYTTTPENETSLRNTITWTIDLYPSLLKNYKVAKVLCAMPDLTYSLLCRKYVV